MPLAEWTCCIEDARRPTMETRAQTTSNDTSERVFLGDGSWSRKAFAGEWIDTEGGPHDVVEPATGERLAVTVSSSPSDMRRAARVAAEAQPAWAARPAADRRALLLEVG